MGNWLLFLFLNKGIIILIILKIIIIILKYLIYNILDKCEGVSFV